MPRPIPNRNMGFNVAPQSQLYQQKIAVYNSQKQASDELNTLRKQAMNLARTLRDEKDEDLVETAVNSKEITHRIAAAWYFGAVLKHDDCLYNLLEDEHPLVVLAAREACCRIAREKYQGRSIDFGPAINAEANIKTDCRAMWQTYFSKKENNTTKESPSTPRTKSPYEILGLPKDDTPLNDEKK